MINETFKVTDNLTPSTFPLFIPRFVRALHEFYEYCVLSDLIPSLLPRDNVVSAYTLQKESTGIKSSEWAWFYEPLFSLSKLMRKELICCTTVGQLSL